MKNFNWDEFRENKIAVHCDTEEKAKNFLNYLYDNSIITNIDFNDWEVFHRNTCFNYEKYKNVSFTKVDYYKSNGYKIIEWEINEYDNFDFILEKALNSPILLEVEKYGKELLSTKIYEYNGEQYIIIKKGNEIIKFDKYED